MDGRRALGGLDVLVNNAGTFPLPPHHRGSLPGVAAQWRTTLGVNLIGAANVTWCAVRHMRSAAAGS